MDEKRYDLELVLIVWDLAQPVPPQTVPNTSFRMENLTARQVHDVKNLAQASWGQMEMNVRPR